MYGLAPAGPGPGPSRRAGDRRRVELNRGLLGAVQRLVRARARWATARLDAVVLVM